MASWYQLGYFLGILSQCRRYWYVTIRSCVVVLSHHISNALDEHIQKSFAHPDTQNITCSFLVIKVNLSVLPLSFLWCPLFYQPGDKNISIILRTSLGKLVKYYTPSRYSLSLLPPGMLLLIYTPLASRSFFYLATFCHIDVSAPWLDASKLNHLGAALWIKEIWSFL